jgi:hypothetical protein
LRNTGPLAGQRQLIPALLFVAALGGALFDDAVGFFVLLGALLPLLRGEVLTAAGLLAGGCARALSLGFGFFTTVCLAGVAEALVLPVEDVAVPLVERLVVELAPEFGFEAGRFVDELAIGRLLRLVELATCGGAVKRRRSPG